VCDNKHKSEETETHSTMPPIETHSTMPPLSQTPPSSFLHPSTIAECWFSKEVLIHKMIQISA